MKRNWLGLSEKYLLIEKIDSIVEQEDLTINWVHSKDDFKRKMQKGEYPVVILAIDDSEVYDLCQQFSLKYPEVSFLIVIREGLYDIRGAMRVGAADIILETASQNEYIDTISALSQREYHIHQTKLIETDPLKNPGQVIVIASTKGGIGKTTLAVNMAATFTKELKRVAIVDANLQFGDVSLFLDCKPKKTIYDWVKEEYDKSIRSVSNHIHIYDNYLHILSAPQRPEFADVITGEHMRALLQLLKQEYDVVIVDTQSSYLEDVNLVTLEEANRILVMTYLDLPTLKNTKILLDTLNSLGLHHKAQVILNRAVKRNKGISDQEAERVLGLPIQGRIIELKGIVLESINEGVPFIFSNPRSKISKDIFHLVKSMLKLKRTERPDVTNQPLLVKSGGAN